MFVFVVVVVVPSASLLRLTSPCYAWSGFGITVDIEDESSGTWMPLPPNSHSLGQSVRMK